MGDVDFWGDGDVGNLLTLVDRTRPQSGQLLQDKDVLFLFFSIVLDSKGGGRKKVKNNNLRPQEPSLTKHQSAPVSQM